METKIINHKDGGCTLMLEVPSSFVLRSIYRDFCNRTGKYIPIKLCNGCYKKRCSFRKCSYHCSEFRPDPNKDLGKEFIDFMNEYFEKQKKKIGSKYENWLYWRSM